MNRKFRVQSLLRILLLTLGLAAMPTQARSDTTVADEYDIKAAIVFKIAKFVSWPDQAFAGLSEPLSVCINAADPLAQALTTLDGRAIHGRVFRVRHLEDTGFDALQCQILVLSDDFSENQQASIELLTNRPVLTIVDNDRPVQRTGIIGLEITRNRVRFAIDVDASEAAGLTISSQLLQLADIRNNRRGT